MLLRSEREVRPRPSSTAVLKLKASTRQTNARRRAKALYYILATYDENEFPAIAKHNLALQSGKPALWLKNARHPMNDTWLRYFAIRQQHTKSQTLRNWISIRRRADKLISDLFYELQHWPTEPWETDRLVDTNLVVDNIRELVITWGQLKRDPLTVTLLDYNLERDWEMNQALPRGNPNRDTGNRYDQFD